MWTWVPSAGWRLSVYRVLGRILVAWRSSVRLDSPPSTHMLVCSTCSKHPPTTIELSVSVWTESVYRGDYCLIHGQCISVCLEIVIISSTGSSCLMIFFQYSVLGLWFCVACQWTTALCSNCRSIWKQVMDICRSQNRLYWWYTHDKRMRLIVQPYYICSSSISSMLTVLVLALPQ